MPNPPDITWRSWNLKYMQDLYGPLAGGFSCIIAVENTLKQWLPAYLAEFNRSLGATVLKEPKTYEFRPTYSTAPRDKSPVLLVDCAETSDVPQRLNSGIRAKWNVDVGVWLYGGTDWRQVQAVTYAYMAAIRAAVVQQGPNQEFIETAKWVGENYGEQDHSATITTGMGLVHFEISVLNAMSPFGGPSSTSIPSLTPPAPTPVIEVVVPTVINTRP